MPENPVEVVGDLLGDMANRLNEYAAIWQDAAKRNAENAYDVDDFGGDMMRVAGLAARDMANVGGTLLSLLGSIARPSEGDAPAEPATARKKKTTAAKAATKKSPSRRPPK